MLLKRCALHREVQETWRTGLTTLPRRKRWFVRQTWVCLHTAMDP